MAVKVNWGKLPPHIRLLFGAQLVVTGLLFAYRFHVVGAKDRQTSLDDALKATDKN